MPDRQCNNIKHNQHTRVDTGDQSLGDITSLYTFLTFQERITSPNGGCLTAALAQLNRNALILFKKSKLNFVYLTCYPGIGYQYLYSPTFYQATINAFKVFLQSTFTVKNVSADIETKCSTFFGFMEVDCNLTLVIIFRNGAVTTRVMRLDLGYSVIKRLVSSCRLHPYSSSVVVLFVLLRCSDFSFRPQASRTHAEKLAFGFSFLSFSMQASIDSTKSYGNRIPLYADLLFLCPVAIGKSHYWCFNTSEHTGGLINAKVFKHKHLDEGNDLDLKCLNTMATGKVLKVSNTAKPRGALTPSGLLTTNDRNSIEAAMKDHITHPQGRNNYTWRFLAINRHDKKAKPCRLSVVAATEREARSILAPHFILSLAARLPVQGVSHG